MEERRVDWHLARSSLGRYAFGQHKDFRGLHIERGRKVLLDYPPNKMQYVAHNCAADEVLVGGSLFCGKTYFLVNHNAAHSLIYKDKAYSVIFRRTFDELERSVVLEFRKLFADKLGKLNSSDFRFDWNSGATTLFRHLQQWDDVYKHDSAQYTLIEFDELTHFEEEMYLYLFQRNRTAAPNVHCQTISTATPGGIGHKWVYERFPKVLTPYTIYRYVLPSRQLGGETIPERVYTRCFVPGVMTDNKEGMKNDPNYISRLEMSMSAREFKAKVEGDWTQFEGRAFLEWDEREHVVDDFAIPLDWKLIRCLDWGYQDPFSVIWLAVNTNLPKERQTIYLVSEWYGAQKGSGGGVHGLQMAPTDFHRELVGREDVWRYSNKMPLPWYGVADPSIWRTDGNTTVASMINGNKMLFRPASRERVGDKGNRVFRKALYHQLLRINPESGKPTFQVFKSCKHFRENFPKLILDEKNPEDIDTRQEDHDYDSCGYGLVELVNTSDIRFDPRGQDKWLKKTTRSLMPV